MSQRYTLEYRKLVTVNTDPLRRCYDGALFSSKEVWTDWKVVYHPANEEDGLDSIKVFSAINPGREYRLLPPSHSATEQT